MTAKSFWICVQPENVFRFGSGCLRDIFFFQSFFVLAARKKNPAAKTREEEDEGDEDEWSGATESKKFPFANIIYLNCLSI